MTNLTEKLVEDNFYKISALLLLRSVIKLCLGDSYEAAILSPNLGYHES